MKNNSDESSKLRIVADDPSKSKDGLEPLLLHKLQSHGQYSQTDQSTQPPPVKLSSVSQQSHTKRPQPYEWQSRGFCIRLAIALLIPPLVFCLTVGVLFVVALVAFGTSVLLLFSPRLLDRLTYENSSKDKSEEQGKL